MRPRLPRPHLGRPTVSGVHQHHGTTGGYRYTQAPLPQAAIDDFPMVVLDDASLAAERRRLRALLAQAIYDPTIPTYPTGKPAGPSNLQVALAIGAGVAAVGSAATLSLILRPIVALAVGGA